MIDAPMASLYCSLRLSLGRDLTWTVSCSCCKRRASSSRPRRRDSHDRACAGRTSEWQHANSIQTCRADPSREQKQCRRAPCPARASNRLGTLVSALLATAIREDHGGASDSRRRPAAAADQGAAQGAECPAAAAAAAPGRRPVEAWGRPRRDQRRGQAQGASRCV